MICAVALFQVLVVPPSLPGTEVDGAFDEWYERPALRLEHGAAVASSDLSGTVHLGFDNRRIHVGVQVVDDLFQPHGADRLELVFGTRRFEVVLGDLEETQPRLSFRGKPVRGARIAGTTRVDGWAVELSLPLAAVPGAFEGPIAFLALVHDVDRDGVAVEAVVGSSPFENGAPVGPTVRFDGAAGLLDAALTSRPPSKSLEVLRGDMGGGAMHEVVHISDQDIIIAGHGLPGGGGFMHFEHGWGPNPTVLEAKLVNLDGKPGAELLVTHRAWPVAGETAVEIVEIYRLTATGIVRAFGHQLSESTPVMKAEARSTFKVLGRGRSPRRLKVSAAKVKGFNEGNYLRLDSGTSFQPLRLPWTTKGPKTFRFKGERWR